MTFEINEIYTESDPSTQPHSDFTAKYDFVVYDETGRITSVCNNNIIYIRHIQMAGQRVVLGLGHWTTHWVDGEPDDVAGVIRLRELLALAPDTLTPAPSQEVSIPDVPAAKVIVSGPVSGEYDHEGGELKIGWTIPGEYSVTIRAFPYLDTTLTLTVMPS